MNIFKEFNRSIFTGKSYASYNNSTIFLSLMCPVEDAVYFGLWEIIEAEYKPRFEVK